MSTRLASVAAVVLVLTGCDGGVDVSSMSGGPSNAGTYFVAWRPTPDPAPLDQPFTMEVVVLERAADGDPVADAALTVSAHLPDHERWLEPDPTARPDGPGRFAVEGLRFDQVGRWVLHLDISRSGMTERAQFDIRVK